MAVVASFCPNLEELLKSIAKTATKQWCRN